MLLFGYMFVCFIVRILRTFIFCSLYNLLVCAILLINPFILLIASVFIRKPTILKSMKQKILSYKLDIRLHSVVLINKLNKV